jgi:DNA-binding LacI/PurR family transcriptional regulator
VLVDNYRGMREAVTHLIEVHDYRRIAFIRGPEGHTEADDRYRAYADVLAEHDIPLDPDLVAPGEFTRVSGMEATKLLLDKRKRRPQVNLEAIIAVDDTTAIGAMNTLQARGIRVPDDVAVVGFDNVEISRHATPPLTTVSSLVYDQARRGTEMVLALMDGEEVPKQVSVTTRLIVRQSCGCLDPAVAQAAAEPTTAAYETFKVETSSWQSN